MTPSASDVMSCRDHIHAALVHQMKSRASDRLWIESERTAVAVAASEWAETHGFDRRVTVDDVERIETRAMGHADYATKLALYVAEEATARADSP